MDHTVHITVAATGLAALRRGIRIRAETLLLAILLVAFGLRVGAALTLDSPPIDVSESGQTAAHLVAGQGYIFDFYGYRKTRPLQSFMPPLYTGVIAACMALTPGSPELTLKLLQAALSSLTSLVIFGIGVELFERRIAFLATLGVALYPVFLVVVTQPTVTVVNTFLLCLLIWVLLRLRRRGALSEAILAGLVLGLSALNRPLIIIFLIPVFWWLWLHHTDLLLGWWQLGIVISLTTALIVTPWILRNVIIHKAPVLISTNGGFTFWNGNNPFTTGSGFDVYADRVNAYLGYQPADGSLDTGNALIVIMEPYPLPPMVRGNLDSLSEAELNLALYHAGWEFIHSQPRHWLGLTVAKFRALWWFRPNIGTYRSFYKSSWTASYKVLYTLLLALALGGILLSRQRWRDTVLLYLLFSTLTVGYVSFNVITRYRWEMEPFLILLAAVPVSQLWVRATRRWQQTRGSVEA